MSQILDENNGDATPLNKTQVRTKDNSPTPINRSNIDGDQTRQGTPAQPVVLTMDIDYYKPMFQQEISPYPYIESHENLLKGHESMIFALNIFEDCLNRWEAQQYTQVLLQENIMDYLTKECSTDLVTLAVTSSFIQYSQSAIKTEEDLDLWVEDEEASTPQADNNIALNRNINVKYICINPEDSSQNITNNAENKSDMQLIDILNNSKLSLASGISNKKSIKKYGGVNDPKKFSKLDISQITRTKKLKNASALNDSILFEDQISFLKNVTDNFNPKPIKLKNDKDSIEKTTLDIEADDLIEWQRSKKYRDDNKKQALMEKIKETTQYGIVYSKLDAEKQKFTFDDDGKVIMIDDKQLENLVNPLILESARVKKVSQIKVLKKGVAETKTKVIIDKRIGTVDPLKNNKQTMVDVVEPLKNYFDYLKPSDGVVFQGNNKRKSGLAIKDILAQQKRITRSQYLEMTQYRELSLGHRNSSSFFDTSDMLINDDNRYADTDNVDENLMISTNNFQFGLNKDNNFRQRNNSLQPMGVIKRSMKLSDLSQLLTDQDLKYSKGQNKDIMGGHFGKNIQNKIDVSKSYSSLKTERLDLGGNAFGLKAGVDLQQNNYFEKSIEGNNGFNTERQSSQLDGQSDLILPQIPKYQSKKRINSLMKSLSQSVLHSNSKSKDGNHFSNAVEFKTLNNDINHKIMGDKGWGDGGGMSARPNYNQNKLPLISPRDQEQKIDLNKIQYNIQSPRMARFVNKQAYIEKIQEQVKDKSQLLKNKIMQASGLLISKRLPPTKISAANRYLNSNME
ncbi:UNKNOWN [Stylonychia lemnae]|uniref:Uncharacterized protein n=1 Tax=Stylonychia lemnae TaxID=5949 RepID=A0A077ZS60_STYLE|nr:UNKNOWN [Stylonychia lemnae]|eukprot:CDW72329.1 UNKNOWN [Stylonychia lemnae]